MRTNIDIDDALMAKAQKAAGHATKKQTVEDALRLMIRLRRQQNIGTAFGKYRWRGRSGAKPARAGGRLIVVDSSVWIDFLNGRGVPHVMALRAALGKQEIVLGALMLYELLQGLDNDRMALQVESLLRGFDIVPMAGDAITVAAARNFRSLRRRGMIIRKIIDLLIGTWCIENRRPLLHHDGDFRPMARYLGLVEVPALA